MSKIENRLLRDLYESVNGLHAFTFYSRYKIEPDQIASFISKYVNKGLVSYEDEKLILTDLGRDLVLKRPIAPRLNNKFSNIPVEYLAEKIEINKPYLPNISDIPKEILTLKKVE